MINDAVQKLIQELFEDKIIKIFSVKDLQSILRQPNVAYIFRKDGEEVIAMTAVFVVKLFSRKLAIIEEVVTLKEHRNKGVGTSMVKEAIEIARKSGCDCVELAVPNRKPEVKKFYESLGFKDRDNASMRLWLKEELEL